MNQRIYAVSDKQTQKVSLVRAGNPSQAIRHIASDRFSTRVASQEELVMLVADGTKVETAGEEPSSDPGPN